MNIKKTFLYFCHILKREVGLNSRNKPKILSYLITDCCNSHCLTCSIWKNNKFHEIPLEKLKDALKSPLLQDIQHVGISGGEPSLCKNLLHHVNIIVNTLPSLETLSITSNCINSNFWINNLKIIYDICKKKHLYFQLNISLDGIGQIHDSIRGTKNNFYNTNKVILFVKEHKIPYQLHSTINKYNIYHINQILNYAKDLNADIIFRLASEIYRLDNTIQLEKVSLTSKQKSFFCDFLRSDSLLNYTRSPGRKLFYKYLVKQILGDGKRLAPCYFKHEGLVLASNGTVSFCSRFKKNFGSIYSNRELMSNYKNDSLFAECAGDSCEYCYHDQTGLWPLKEVLNIYFEKYMVPLRKVMEIIRLLTHSFCTRASNIQRNQNVTSISLIGMFGGEHVGDSAILGGVILRTLKRFPHISTINIYSFREDRTQCWVKCITEIPNSISISVTDNINVFRNLLKQSQLLIWAGGPLMELPVVLSRNYAFIKDSLSYGCKFELEGVGYGPINGVFGKSIVKMILKKSSRTTVRSLEDMNALHNIGIPVELGQETVDPSFDYLKILPKSIELKKDEQSIIDKLTKKEAGQKIMALNLRPLWNRYGNKKTFDFESFLDEISKVIDKLFTRSVITVFIPMNADQFGFSDLDVAYAIKKRVKDTRSFKIWEVEPSINSAIYMFRKVDFSLCMRFHAVIFSMSQGVMTYGLDYNLNGNGKVKTLFKKRKKDCISIIDFDGDKFFNRVC